MVEDLYFMGTFGYFSWNFIDVVSPFKSVEKKNGNKESKGKRLNLFWVAVILNAPTERSKNLPDTQKERAMQT